MIYHGYENGWRTLGRVAVELARGEALTSARFGLLAAHEIRPRAQVQRALLNLLVQRGALFLVDLSARLGEQLIQLLV